MSWAFPLANGQVIQVTQSGVAMDQLVQNRFDIVIDNLSAGVSSDLLLTSIQAQWANDFVPLISDRYIHVQTKVQVVTDVRTGVSSPRRVMGLMDRTGATALNDGGNGGSALPYDVTVSCSLIVDGPPGPNWGRKSFGPIVTTDVVTNGEEMDVVRRAAWNSATDNFFIAPHTISVTTATWTCVVVPATAIAALPLPHAALNTLVKDVIGTDIGYYVGSQSTRRITPYSMRGH